MPFSVRLSLLSAALVAGAGLCSAINSPSSQAQPQAVAGLTQYTFGTPDDDETAILEYINRARSNPPAEGQRLVAAIPYLYDIGSGTVDATKLLADYSTYPFRPPLVFNAILMGTATAHTADMIATGVLSHDGSDGSTPESQLYDAGYPPDLSAECCNGSTYAGEPSVPSFSAWELHATYQYDIGNPYPEHRILILDTNLVSEVEIGMGNRELGGWNTLDIGSAHTKPLLGGVVYTDLAAINFYAPGEGISNVVVTAPGFSSYYAVTVASGAYSLPLDLTPSCQDGSPTPVVTVVFTDAAGHTNSQAVTLTRTTLSADPNYYQEYTDATGLPRYDNAKADWIMPTPDSGATPTPTPTRRRPRRRHADAHTDAQHAYARADSSPRSNRHTYSFPGSNRHANACSHPHVNVNVNTHPRAHCNARPNRCEADGDDYAGGEREPLRADSHGRRD